ncbi:two-component system chemotaxis sensor kinase CheA [Salibacterium salarium]|uniref:chemotaxis protein CheA n=1 Tax=Salibacterium salarium TaxID=284579 RepID=UPI00278B7650|nr:chemotaxis protein CheA [Salibacterium salarium]MDQ0298722.1 two-component system chemotaxis sensor kinase CheA [Salibacterium salarium]
MSQEYLEVFIDESQEHLQTLNDNLMQLEKEPEDISIVGEIFRSAHTLKGMGATMGFEDLAHLTHSMENVLDLIRNEQLEVTSHVMDAVFESVDDLEEMILDISKGGDGKRDVGEAVKKLEVLQNGEEAEASSETAASVEEKPEPSASSQISESFDEYERTVLVQSVEQGYQPYIIEITLDENTMLKAARVYMVFEVLEDIGDIIKSTPSADDLEDEKFDSSFAVTVISTAEADELEQRIMKVSEITSVTIEEVNVDQASEAEKDNKKEDKKEGNESGADSSSQKKEKPAKQDNNNDKKESAGKKGSELNKTIRVNIDRLDVLMNLFEELVIDRGRLEQISNDLNNSELNETVERMSRISGDLQEIILNMRMMPVDQVFNRFPRMVRSLSKELGKQVSLDITGAETELDRTIIDEIGDPLVHLLRNSIDHGIEEPEEREAAGKPAQGTVLLRAYHSGNNVFIEIEDDGAGINKDKIIQKSLDNGVVTEEDLEKMTDQQIYGLLFASGFSTAEEITDISGRGVGLDVVRSTFESLGGTVTVDSEYGQGSLFSVQLPLTLSIIDVMLVEVGSEKYAVPLTAIVETAIVNKNEVYSAHNQKVIDFRGKVVPLVFLNDIFDVPAKNENENDFYSLVIVSKGDKIAGLVVDSLIGQHDIVLKSLGNYLSNVFAISGATILGDGQVALILDSNALIK